MSSYSRHGILQLLGTYLLTSGTLPLYTTSKLSLPTIIGSPWVLVCRTDWCSGCYKFPQQTSEQFPFEILMKFATAAKEEGDRLPFPPSFCSLMFPLFCYDIYYLIKQLHFFFSPSAYM